MEKKLIFKFDIYDIAFGIFESLSAHFLNK